MKKFFSSLVLGMLCLLLSSCGSHMMAPAQTLTAVENDYALVSFVRPSAFGGAIRFSLWDSDQFIGVLTAGSIIQYKVTPGEHVFIARGENWSYVKANVRAGRHYIVEGKVFPGVWKARVGLAPIDVNEPGYKGKAEKWLNSLNPISVKPELVEGYVTPRLAQVKEALENYHQGGVKFAVMEADFSF